jgi:hemolysin activation/secretion protein
MRRAAPSRLILAACVPALFAVAATPVLHAQTYSQVAPSQPAPGTVRAPGNLPAAEKARRTKQTAAVQLDHLKGVVFVSSAKEVQAAGTTSRAPINPGDVDFAARPDFQSQIAPFIGQPVTLDSLDQLTSAVVHYYRAHNRPIVNVFVPQQNITQGYIQVVVAEGRVGEVRATGSEWFGNDVLRSELRLHANQRIDGQMLTSDLDWLNRNPFHQSDVVFSPGAQPGLTDVTLKTADRFPARIYAGLDDAGNQFTGDYRYFTGFNYGDLFGLDQQLSYQYTTAEDSNLLTAHSGTYIIPLPWRHQLTFFGSYGEVHSSMPGLVDASGVNWQASMRYEIPLPGSVNFHQSLIGGFDFKQSNNDLAFGGSTISNVYTDTDQFVAGYEASYVDPYGTTSGSITGFYSPGKLSGGDNDTVYQATRFGARADYAYGVLTLDRVTQLPWNFTWSEHGLLQESNANLLPTEQIGLGGFETVRGYDEREANGDNGFLISSELATPPISLGNLVGIAAASDQLQFLGFVDYGGTSLHNAGPSDVNPNTNLLGVGPGLRYAITPYMSFRFDYGFQLIRTGFDSRYDSRGHIGLTMSLPGGIDDHVPVSQSTPPAKGPFDGGDAPVDFASGDSAEDGSGFNAGIYGGATAFQNGTSTLTSPTTSAVLYASLKSEIGGVGGVRAGYDWKNVTWLPDYMMPSLDADFFYAGYQYHSAASTADFAGSYVTSDLDTYSLMLEPKLKFRLGQFHPYVGFGVGATYLTSGSSHINVNVPNGGAILNENTTYSKTFQAAGFSAVAMAGVDYFLTKNWALNFEYTYQYLDVDGSIHAKLSGVPVQYHVDGLGTHLFTAGISYFF